MPWGFHEAIRETTAVYLALPQSGYITGVRLPVDGGFLSCGVVKRG